MLTNSLNNQIDRDAAAVASYLSNNQRVGPLEWKTFVDFGKLIWRYPKALLVSVVALLVSTLCTLAGPRILGYVVDLGLVPRDISMLRVLFCIFAVSEALRHIANNAKVKSFGRLGLSVMHDLRMSLFEHVLKLDLRVLDKNSTGQLLSRVTTDTAALAQVFTAGVVNMLDKFLSVIGIMIVLCVLNLKLSVMAIALIPILLVAGVLMSRAIYRYTRDVGNKIGATTAFLTESLQGAIAIRLLDGQTRQSRRFTLLNSWLKNAQLRPMFLNAFFHPSMTLVNACTVALLMLIGGGMVRHGEISLGVLVSFLSYVLWLFSPVIHIVNQWTVIVAGLASAERVFKVLDWRIEGPEELSNMTTLKGEIAFENVWFAYVGEDWILKDVSFTIPVSSRVGVVGPTGSGKTTIVALIFRLYDPQKGKVFLYGLLITEWSREALRNCLGLVQQDGALFEGSIAENISLYGTRPLPTADLIKQLTLPDLARDCDSLSAGERQLVAFARALNREPLLWVLDEAASHLDPTLDEELHRLFDDKRKGGTVVVVSHRLSSVRSLDLIFVMYQGRLVESGTHMGLVRKAGLYSRMVAIQDNGTA